MKDVAVTHETDAGVGVLAWFDTVQEAEHFIAIREHTDPKGVYEGRYGIDAPEEMNTVNDPDEAANAEVLA